MTPDGLEKLFLVTQSIFAIIGSLFLIIFGVLVVISFEKIKNILEDIKNITRKTLDSIENISFSALVYKIINFFKRKEER